MKSIIILVAFCSAAWAQDGGVIPAPDIVGAVAQAQKAGNEAQVQAAQNALIRQQTALLKQQTELLRQQNAAAQQARIAAQSSIDYAKSGDDFLAACDQPGPVTVEKFECASYVEGVSAGIELGIQMQFLDTHPGQTQAPNVYCYPANATTGLAMQTFVEFIKGHPMQAHRQTRLLIFAAMSQAFSCPATPARPAPH